MRQTRQGAAIGGFLALERALDLLELFVRKQTREIAVADLIAELGLPRSTLYRFLKVLKHRGFLDDGSRRGWVQLGAKLALLAAEADGSADIARAARPILRELVAATGETAFVTLRSGDFALCVEREESPLGVRLAYEKGRMMPLHAGCSAKVLLAGLAPEEQERFLRRPLERYTERTVTDPGLLRAELARIRRDGFAISTGETDPGAAAVCVPVPGAHGRPLAALTLAGPAFRVDGDRLEHFQTLVREAAGRLALALHGRAGTTGRRRPSTRPAAMAPRAWTRPDDRHATTDNQGSRP